MKHFSVVIIYEKGSFDWWFWYQFDLERQVSPERSFARWSSNLELCQWTTKTYLNVKHLQFNVSTKIVHGFSVSIMVYLPIFFPMHPFSFYIGRKFFKRDRQSIFIFYIHKKANQPVLTRIFGYFPKYMNYLKIAVLKRPFLSWVLISKTQKLASNGTLTHCF